MIRLLAFLAIAVAAFATVLPTKKQDTAQYWFPGHVQWGPRDCTQLDASTPLNASGVHTWCTNCQRTDPCACGGPGAEARTEDGQWKCAEAGLTCADCETACVAPGGACTVTCDCCSGVCFMGVCKDVITCADIGTTCNICPDISACNLTSTTTTSTTTSTTTTVTVTTTSTSTTSGTGTTSTTTTTVSTTTTTTEFASTGFAFSQNLLGGSAVFGGDGRAPASAIGAGLLSPATGTADRLAVVCDLAPSQADPTCNNTSIPCPVWLFCLMQSDAPYGEASFSDSALCCSMNAVIPACENTNTPVAVHEGALMMAHGVTVSSTPFTRCRVSWEVGP